MNRKNNYSIDDPIFGFDEDFEVGANKVLMLGGSDAYTPKSTATPHPNRPERAALHIAHQTASPLQGSNTWKNPIPRALPWAGGCHAPSGR
mgnify:CR=1 FL=1